MNIRNNRDLKFAYDLLLFAKEMGHEKKFDQLKREIRAYNKRPADEARIIKDDGIDGCIVLLPLPERIKHADVAEEYFMETEYRVCRPSAYDCTGQIFTSWFKIFQRHGRFWAYHSLSVDV
jgi:hypothetical protein